MPYRNSTTLNATIKRLSKRNKTLQDLVRGGNGPPLLDMIYSIDGVNVLGTVCQGSIKLLMHTTVLIVYLKDLYWKFSANIFFPKSLNS